MIFAVLLLTASAPTRFVACSDTFMREFAKVAPLETAEARIDSVAIDCSVRAIVVRGRNGIVQQTWTPLSSCQGFAACDGEARIAALLASELVSAESAVSNAPRMQGAIEMPRIFAPDPTWRKPVRGVSIAGLSVGGLALVFGTTFLAVGVSAAPDTQASRDMVLGSSLTIVAASGMITASIVGLVLSRKVQSFTISVTNNGIYASGKF